MYTPGVGMDSKKLSKTRVSKDPAGASYVDSPLTIAWVDTKRSFFPQKGRNEYLSSISVFASSRCFQDDSVVAQVAQPIRDKAELQARYIGF